MRRRRKSKFAPLTVLSFGAGQESSSLLERILAEQELREEIAPEALLVLCSDTVDEHPPTYLHILATESMCKKHKNVDFVQIRPSMGFHTPSWNGGLREHYRRNRTVGSKAFVKSCTDNLKIKPIYNYLNYYISQRYGFDRHGPVWNGRYSIVSFAQKYGKIRMLLGFGKGEESRISDEEACPKWMQLSIIRQFPLIDWGWDRAKCQDYIRSLGKPVPPPSNCMLCPWMNKIELLWLARRYPADFQEWVELEKAKLEKFAHLGERNVGVFGSRKTLPEILAEAEKQHGHMTLEELEDYRFSHGHCVRSRY